ncbi:MAG TPA: AMP-binding protein, partial [Solirubrobacter sp.]|nr:AMP-binding protein [Solirubrobacter sp.]
MGRLAGTGETTALSLIDELGVIERITFADVARGAAPWAELLRDSAVEPGERVLVLAGQDRDWRTVLLGAVQAGAVAVPCPASLPADAVLDRARHCGASLIVSAVARPELELEPAAPVVVVEDVRRRLSDQRPSTGPAPTAARDAALVVYQDDPGGLRGVTHTHGSLLAQALSGPHWLSARARSRVLCTAEDGSAESVWVMLAAWGAGAELVSDVRQLDAQGRLDLLDGLAVDVLWLAPEEYRVLAAAEHPGWYDLSRISRALALEVDAETATALRETFGLSIEGVFGLPEAGVLAVGAPLQPLPDLELGLADDRGRPSAAGEPGELVVRDRPASLFAGYWNAPRATAAAFRKDAFRTGLQASFAADGSLRVLGRAAPMLELVEDETAAPAPLLDDEPVAVPLSDVAAAPAPAPAPELTPPAKPGRDDRRRQREAEALRRVAEQARRERDELEDLRRTRDERLVEEQRRLEARRLREQEKARRLGDDRSEQVARNDDEERRREAERAARAQQQEDARRRREQEQTAAEERRRADEERRRERDRERRAEKDAARAAKQAAAEAKSAEKRAREEAARAARQAAADAKAAEKRSRDDAKAADQRARQDAERARREAASAEQARVEGERAAR